MQKKLTTEEMNADFGLSYIELKKEYPNWSSDLHEKGHILDIEFLEKIFCRGLLLWYIRYCMKKTSLNLFSNSNIEYNSFYEITSLIKFFGVINPEIISKKLLEVVKHDSYQSLLLTDIVKPCASFKIYLKKHNLISDLNDLTTQKLNCDLTYTNLCKDKSLELFIYEVLAETAVVKLGIVFQRWKIVLEQMCIKSKNKDDKFQKKIYIVDNFLSSVQEMIFFAIKTQTEIIKNVLISNDIHKVHVYKINLENLYEHYIYKNIFKEIIKNDLLMHKITDPENLDEMTILLLKSFCENKN